MICWLHSLCVLCTLAPTSVSVIACFSARSVCNAWMDAHAKSWLCFSNSHSCMYYYELWCFMTLTVVMNTHYLYNVHHFVVDKFHCTMVTAATAAMTSVVSPPLRVPVLRCFSLFLPHKFLSFMPSLVFTLSISLLLPRSPRHMGVLRCGSQSLHAHIRHSSGSTSQRCTIKL